MFIPIRDDNPALLKPYVTVTIIGINVLVFAYQLSFPRELLMQWYYNLGVVPGNIIRDSVIASAVPFVSSLFVHGGFLHLAGNMLYLWIFGDNIESTLGHARFILFYLVCGLAATVTQLGVHFEEGIPIIGASGAISGVLGAYLFRYPLARIHVLVFLFFFITRVFIPAWVVLGFWFLVQLSSGLGTLSMAGGGVAWFAHIGGFLCGVILLYILKKQPGMNNVFYR